MYTDSANCSKPIHKEYHQRLTHETGVTEGGVTPSTKEDTTASAATARGIRRMFSYVDQDDYDDPEDRHMATTTLPGAPSHLEEAVSRVRLRHGVRPKTGPGRGTFVSATPVTTDRSETQQASHVVSTPFQVMHIMADLQPLHSSEASRMASDLFEMKLCTIKVTVLLYLRCLGAHMLLRCGGVARVMGH